MARKNKGTDSLESREFVADERTTTLARESRQRVHKGGNAWDSFGMAALPSERDLEAVETDAHKHYRSAREAYEAARQAKANAAHVRREFIVALGDFDRVGKHEGAEYVSWTAVASVMGVSRQYVSKVRKAHAAKVAERAQRREIREAAKAAGLEDGLSSAAVRAALDGGDEGVAAAVRTLEAGKPLDAPVKSVPVADVAKAAERILAMVRESVDGEAAALEAVAADLRKASEILRTYAKAAASA